MRTVANNNHSTQARRLLGRLIPINTSFAETARWKRRVPMVISTKPQKANVHPPNRAYLDTIRIDRILLRFTVNRALCAGCDRGNGCKQSLDLSRLRKKEKR